MSIRIKPQPPGKMPSLTAKDLEEVLDWLETRRRQFLAGRVSCRSAAVDDPTGSMMANVAYYRDAERGLRYVMAQLRQLIKARKA